MTDIQSKVDNSPEIGTPGYMGPEIFKFTIHRNTDVFAAGVILFSLLTGYFPYSGKSRKEIFLNNKKAVVAFKTYTWNRIS